MRLSRYPLLFILLWLVSCKQTNKENTTVSAKFQPVSIATNGVKIPDKNSIAPVTLPLKITKTIIAGKPTEVKAHTNVFILPDTIPSFKINNESIEKKNNRQCWRAFSEIQNSTK